MRQLAITLMLMGLLLTACSSTLISSAEATAQAAIVATQSAQSVNTSIPELTAVQTSTSLATRTHTPTTTPEPTYTPIPSNTSAPLSTVSPTPKVLLVSPTRIQFPLGTTFFALRDQGIAANSVDEYILRAMGGQELMIDVNPYSFQDYENFTFTVYGAEDGALLAFDVVGYWSGVVPTTQDYIVEIVNHGNSTIYTLGITIPRRIVFASGATFTTIEGNIVEPSSINSYVLHARKDQTMAVNISSRNDNELCLSIVGSDGQPIVRSHLCQTSWMGLLHATQDYSVSIMVCECKEATSNSVSYTLEVSVTD